ncbi:phage portal protein [Campylobacter hyointestinalis subsp. hyointestinalis]|uniref:Phage portal protein n=1 Tax=Campylobacter hyointestinalis subsp. hyointestinalis TaxID=91352 RepID=A0A0S4SDG8_CAMHY|nr:hypothetical protein [Campylobacter hyointestinalis]CUU83365.1 phage portal protein [Campylobacter hyointestinalis subsp. hyointestinalis]
MDRFYFQKEAKQSLQLKEECIYSNGIIEPFFSFSQLLDAYYSNVYHRRAIKIKAGLLSQIELENSNLAEFLPPNISPKTFLNIFALNLELYGNAAIEKSGKSSFFYITYQLMR